MAERWMRAFGHPVDEDAACTSHINMYSQVSLVISLILHTPMLLALPQHPEHNRSQIQPSVEASCLSLALLFAYSVVWVFLSAVGLGARIKDGILTVTDQCSEGDFPGCLLSLRTIRQCSPESGPEDEDDREENEQNAITKSDDKKGDRRGLREKTPGPDCHDEGRRPKRDREKETSGEASHVAPTVQHKRALLLPALEPPRREETDWSGVKPYNISRTLQLSALELQSRGKTDWSGVGCSRRTELLQQESDEPGSADWSDGAAVKSTGGARTSEVLGW
ncbi:hypothetical protein NDU88_002854 [Pleurodeles waltl]|uniref:Uncharacterized protein n=1 Tax=Pleurodeles waltl TaxID=8319 RepID=A0AAV7SER4_PLEWA|nr:hypothetical protein NDU88_002854 [Pleurodeles waltl]